MDNGIINSLWACDEIPKEGYIESIITIVITFDG